MEPQWTKPIAEGALIFLKVASLTSSLTSSYISGAGAAGLDCWRTESDDTLEGACVCVCACACVCVDARACNSYETIAVVSQ